MLLLVIIGLAVNFSSLAQRAVHHGYITYYNAYKKAPDSVVYDLYPSMLNCEKARRKDAFAPDPKIPDCVGPNAYKGSGYSKGHLFSYESAKCDPADRTECFYMSNMLPQSQSMNAGDWKKLEMLERTWASERRLHILAGGIGSIGRTPGGVNIPEQCWKALFYDGQWHCYLIRNSSWSVGHDIGDLQISKDQLNQMTGLHLK